MNRRRDGGRSRTRTCDFYRVKVHYQLCKLLSDAQ